MTRRAFGLSTVVSSLDAGFLDELQKFRSSEVLPESLKGRLDGIRGSVNGRLYLLKCREVVYEFPCRLCSRKAYVYLSSSGFWDVRVRTLRTISLFPSVEYSLSRKLMLLG